MAGQGKDPFEGLGEFARYFRDFNPESAQQQKQEEIPQHPQQESKKQQGRLEVAIAQAIKEAATKGKKLSREDSLRICVQFGVDLNQYDYCGMSDKRHGENTVFYIGDEPPKVVPEDVPLAALMAVKPDYRMMCTDHSALAAINQDAKNKDPNTKWGKYIGWEAAVINKWQELNMQAAKEQLAQLGYQGVEVLTFKESVRRGKTLDRERQAILFAPSSSYTQEQKQSILARLRGEVLPEAAAQTYAASQAQQPRAPSASVPTTPESGRPGGGIEELLPKGGTEERQLPGGRIEVTQITLKIAYDGNPANFEQIRYLNSVIQAAGLDCAIDPNDPQKVEFRVRDYLKRPEAAKELENKLRILVLLNHLTAMHVSSSIEDFINQQVKDPQQRKELLGKIMPYMSKQGRISEQQTL